jgi:adenylate cyclase, class 2
VLTHPIAVISLGRLTIFFAIANSPMFAMGARKLEKYLTRQFERNVSRSSVEREQKYRVARIDPLRKRLLKLGAEVHASGFERNELFDCGDRLRRQGLKLRLRRHGGKIAVLTLKGPRRNGSQKTRMEVETAVEYEAAKRILELLDFRVKETYSKRREEYRLDGCPVCLDYIPNAGWFVEIEGPARKISDTARLLGLRAADRERRSYRRLIKDAATLSLSAAA